MINTWGQRVPILDAPIRASLSGAETTTYCASRGALLEDVVAFFQVATLFI